MRRARAAATACASFPPLVGTAPRVLVLGSMPGARSLAEQRYYAHPHNLFWRFMGEICGLDPAADYARRTAHLARCGIALWDVLAHCERSGSLDGAIVRATEVPNPVADLLARRRSIHTVALNGGKAAQAFERHVRPVLAAAIAARLTVLAMPSTSPANASIALATKRAAWLALRARLADASAPGRDAHRR